MKSTPKSSSLRVIPHSGHSPDLVELATKLQTKLQPVLLLGEEASLLPNPCGAVAALYHLFTRRAYLVSGSKDGFLLLISEGLNWTQAREIGQCLSTASLCDQASETYVLFYQIWSEDATLVTSCDLLSTWKHDFGASRVLESLGVRSKQSVFQRCVSSVKRVIGHEKKKLPFFGVSVSL